MIDGPGPSLTTADEDPFFRAVCARRICRARSVPFKHADSTLTLVPDAEGTLATFDYRYVSRGGPLGRLAGPLIDKMLTGTFTDMLAATDEAARASGSER